MVHIKCRNLVTSYVEIVSKERLQVFTTTKVVRIVCKVGNVVRYKSFFELIDIKVGHNVKDNLVPVLVVYNLLTIKHCG